MFGTRAVDSLRRFAVLVVLQLLVNCELRAEVTLYFDKAEYRAALADQSYLRVTERFEDDDAWGLVRSSITSGSFSAPDVPSQGITWTGSGGGIHGVTTSEGAARSGDWGFYSSPHHDILNGIPDGFTVTAAQPIYGFAGYIRGAHGADIILILDGNEGNPVDLGEICTPDPNGEDENCIDRNLANTPFVGLIDPDGFSRVEVRETEAGGDEAILLFSDDFTFGFSTIPSPRTPGIAWGNPAGGVFSIGSDWNGGQPPTAVENALFDLASVTPYNVTFAQSATNAQAVISDDQLVFDFGGNQYQLTETNPTRESLIVGELAGDIASLSITGGNLIAQNAVVAHSSGSTGSLTVDSGALLAVANQLRVGSGGSGTVVVNGGTTTAGEMVVGRFGGSGSVAVHGSNASASATVLVVGGDGGGTVVVDHGAALQSVSADIAVASDGSVVLDGVGTRWTNTASELNIGAGDQVGSFYSSSSSELHVGTVNVENGAELESKVTYIGRTRTGRGVLNVTGPDSSWLAGVGSPNFNTFIGYEGDGEVNILQGASAQTSQTFVGRFGIRDRLKGVVNVDGADSTWTSTSTIWVGFNNDPQFYSGASLFFAEGRVNVTNGGVVSANQLVLAGRKISKGVVHVSGADSVVAANSVVFGKSSTTTFTFGSNAEMNLSNGGQLDVSGNVDVHHGRLSLDQGTLNANTLRLHGKLLIDPGDEFETGDTRVTFSGNGLINANVENEGGFVEPGFSAGVLNIVGDYTQAIDGTLAIELGGTDNSDPMNLQYDQLLIDGIAVLDGTLDVTLIDLGGSAWEPQLGDSFGILSASGGFGGMFNTIQLPELSSGLDWQFNPGGQTLFLNVVSNLTADFDMDGDVDHADFATWESSYGVDVGADADNDGDSDGADFLAWQRQFTGPTAPPAAAAPEPSSLLLAWCCGATRLLRRREWRLPVA